MATEILLSTISVSIAGIALIISAWNNIQGRKHNRNSLKPLLTYEVSFGGNDSLLGISIQNCGLGPAIIDSFEIYYDDERYLTWELLMLRQMELNRHFYTPHNQLEQPSFTQLAQDSVIPVSTRLHLYAIPFNYVLNHNLMRKELLGSIKVKITYHSLYEDKRTLLINYNKVKK